MKLRVPHATELNDSLPSYFRTDVNGCKTYGCPNLGISDPSRYTRSKRLGYEAYHCPKCGAYPPVLLSKPINDLLRQLCHHQCLPDIRQCPQCFQDQDSNNNPKTVRAYGVTSAGTPRVQCRQCLHVFSLLNKERLFEQLQPLWTLLQKSHADVLSDVNGQADCVVTTDMLRVSSGLSPQVFYRRMALLSQLLQQYASRVETKGIARYNKGDLGANDSGNDDDSRTNEDGTNNENNIAPLSLQTNSHVVRCRSGLAGSHGCDTWWLTTAESQTGYQLLQSANVLIHREALGNRPYQGAYQLTTCEGDINETETLFETATLTYGRIMARRQFDELAYCDGEYRHLKDGVLLRPVYAAHAHFQFLNVLLVPVSHTNFILQHESFIRGAAIFAFQQPVIDKRCQLYYLHYSMMNVSKECHTSVCDKSPKHQMLSWWNENWQQRMHVYQSQQWQLCVGRLTQQGQAHVVTTRPDWNADFWHGFDAWLPATYRTKLSYSMLCTWLGIYRFLYNFQQEPSRNELFLRHNMDTQSIKSLVSYLNQE